MLLSAGKAPGPRAVAEGSIWGAPGYLGSLGEEGRGETESVLLGCCQLVASIRRGRGVGDLGLGYCQDLRLCRMVAQKGFCTPPQTLEAVHVNFEAYAVSIQTHEDLQLASQHGLTCFDLN